MKGTILSAVAAALALSGCSADYVTTNQADVLLEIVKIEAAAGKKGGGGTKGAVLHSDVVTKDGIFNDTASVTFTVLTKNPLFTPTNPVNDVQLQRYEIRYLRSDGRNVEGVDVPYRITGPLSLRIPAGGDGEESFDVVRHQAKEEPPLRNLASGGAIVLTTIAEMTFHGQTTSGKVVTATGRLQITFANFGDE
jgi:hypothetical protein